MYKRQVQGGLGILGDAINVTGASAEEVTLAAASTKAYSAGTMFEYQYDDADSNTEFEIIMTTAPVAIGDTTMAVTRNLLNSTLRPAISRRQIKILTAPEPLQTVCIGVARRIQWQIDTSDPNLLEEEKRLLDGYERILDLYK